MRRRSGTAGVVFGRAGLIFVAALLPSPRARAADAGPAPAVADLDAPTVTARVDKNDAHVGDAITLTITAISRRGVAVNLPSTLDLGAFSVLDRKEAAERDLGDGHVRREFLLTVAAYEPGETQLPAVDVTYLGKGGDVRTARTEPVAIKISSLLANEPEPAMKDNAGPVTVWQQDLLLVYIAAAILAAGLGALLTWVILRRLRARARHRPGPPPRPAHEVALERLDRLGAYGFLENADNRPFYFAVSEVIRDYLGARFAFDSLEMTTDELVAHLRKWAPRELVLGEIEGWLSAADLVKFAKISPSAAEARGALETAIRIVTSTKPRPVEPGAGAGPSTPMPSAAASSPASSSSSSGGVARG